MCTWHRITSARCSRVPWVTRGVHRTACSGPIWKGCRCERSRAETPVRVVDLRDDQLEHYGMTREQIVAAPSEHYSCTRAWALRRSRLNIGGHSTAGFLWNSRQAEIAADHAEAALRVLLTVSEQTGHVAVVYDHAGIGDALFESSVIYAGLSQGAGLAFVRDIATAVGLFVED